MDYAKLSSLVATAMNHRPTKGKMDRDQLRLVCGYHELENSVLAETLALAREFPGSRRECWAMMAEAFKRANRQLRRKKMPNLVIVSFPVFCQQLDHTATTERQ